MEIDEIKEASLLGLEVFLGMKPHGSRSTASIDPMLLIMLHFLTLFPVVIRLLPRLRFVKMYIDVLYRSKA